MQLLIVLCLKIIEYRVDVQMISSHWKRNEVWYRARARILVYILMNMNKLKHF
jgi:hypothetical protein